MYNPLTTKTIEELTVSLSDTDLTALHVAIATSDNHPYQAITNAFKKNNTGQTCCIDISEVCKYRYAFFFFFTIGFTTDAHELAISFCTVILSKSACVNLDDLIMSIYTRDAMAFTYINNKPSIILDKTEPCAVIHWNKLKSFTINFPQTKVSYVVENSNFSGETREIDFDFTLYRFFSCDGRPVCENLRTLQDLWCILNTFYTQSSCSHLFTYVGNFIADNNATKEIVCHPTYDVIVNCRCVGEKHLKELQLLYVTEVYPCRAFPTSFIITDQSFIFSSEAYLALCPKCTDCYIISNNDECDGVYSNYIHATTKVCSIKKICRNVNKLLIDITIDAPKESVCPFLNIENIEGCITVFSHDFEKATKILIAKGLFDSNTTNGQVLFSKCSNNYISEKSLVYNKPSKYQIHYTDSHDVSLPMHATKFDHYNLNEILTEFINKINCQDRLKLTASIPLSIYSNVCDCSINPCDILSPCNCNIEVCFKMSLHINAEPNLIAEAIVLNE